MALNPGVGMKYLREDSAVGHCAYYLIVFIIVISLILPDAVFPIHLAAGVRSAGQEAVGQQTSIDSLLRIAQELHSQQKYDLAIASFRFLIQEIDKSPDPKVREKNEETKAQSYLMIADCYIKLGDKDNAKQAFFGYFDLKADLDEDPLLFEGIGIVYGEAKAEYRAMLSQKAMERAAVRDAERAKAEAARIKEEKRRLEEARKEEERKLKEAEALEAARVRAEAARIRDEERSREEARKNEERLKKEAADLEAKRVKEEADRKKREEAEAKKAEKAKEEARIKEEARVREEARREEERKNKEAAAIEDARKQAEAARIKEVERAEEKARKEKESKRKEQLAIEEARKKSEADRLKSEEAEAKKAEKVKEETRLKEEARAREDARKEEERKIKEAAAIEDARKKAEAARIKEQKRAEEKARKEEESKRKEQLAIEEARKKSEADRIKSEEAEAKKAERAKEETRLKQEARAREDARKEEERKRKEAAAIEEAREKAETNRLKEEKRVQEEAKKEEERKKREAAAIVAAGKKAETARIKEEARAKEKARKEEETKRQEEAVIEAARKKAEADRMKSAEAAARKAEKLKEESMPKEEARIREEAAVLETAKKAEAKPAEEIKGQAQPKPVVKTKVGAGDSGKKKGRFPWLIAGGLAVGGAAAVLLLGKGSGGSSNGGDSPGPGTPTTGSIQVNSTPSGARIFLDNVDRGTTPATISDVSVGSHAIRLTRENYRDYSDTVYVSGGQTTQFNATLSKNTISVTRPISGQSYKIGSTVSVIWETDTAVLAGNYFGNVPAGLLNQISGRVGLAARAAGGPAISMRAANIGAQAHRNNHDIQSSNSSAGDTRIGMVGLGREKRDITPSRLKVPGLILSGQMGGVGFPPTGANSISIRTQYISNVSIGLYKNHSWTLTIQQSTLNDGRYDWTIPKDSGLVTGNDYSILISSTTDDSVFGWGKSFRIYKNVGSIKVTSNPRGARVYLDEIDQNRITPCTLPDIEPGTHTVRVEKAGYETQSKIVKVTANQEINVAFNLSKQAETGLIKVTSTPSGASVYLDEDFMDKVTPCTLTGVATGRHTVRVEKDGYIPKEKDVMVQADKTSAVSLTLEKESGNGDIHIVSRPSGARVYLDGHDQGKTTECTITNVRSGSHSLRLVLDYYGQFEKEIKVSDRKVTEVDANLSPYTYEFERKWGSYGNRDGQFKNPNCIAVDNLRNVYVSDYNNHRIQKFNSFGGYARKWGGQGTEFGQFMYVYGVAADDSRNVYVADRNHRIQKFNSDGDYLTLWGRFGEDKGQFKYPAGVAVDDSEKVYVADCDNHRIQKFTSSGKYLTQWGSQGRGIKQFSSPVGVAVDKSGNVYVAEYDNHRIQKFTSSGEYLTQWGNNGKGISQFNHPVGVAVDNSGNVYVSDYDNHRIQKFSSLGVYITQWGSYGTGNGEFDHPFGVALDNSGNVYVAEERNNRIQKFRITDQTEQMTGAAQQFVPAINTLQLQRTSRLDRDRLIDQQQNNADKRGKKQENGGRDERP